MEYLCSVLMDELYVATLDDCYASDGRAEMLAGEKRD